MMLRLDRYTSAKAEDIRKSSIKIPAAPSAAPKFNQENTDNLPTTNNINKSIHDIMFRLQK